MLSNIERSVFFSNYFPMLFYAAVYEGLMSETSVLTDMIDTSMEIKIKAREALFEDEEILNYFKRDNAHILTRENLAFLSNVQSGIFGGFVVLKETKIFSVLQNADSEKFYHVHNITDRFNDMLAYIPTYITTAIFNFDGKIICDGLIDASNICLGKNIEQGLTEKYNNCKRNNTVEEWIKMI